MIKILHFGKDQSNQCTMIIELRWKFVIHTVHVCWQKA